MLEVLGIVGAVVLTYSNIPQLVLFYRQGHAEGISAASQWIGTAGFMCRCIYVCYTIPFDWIIYGPYIFAWVATFITFYYMYFPRKESI